MLPVLEKPIYYKNLARIVCAVNKELEIIHFFKNDIRSEIVDSYIDKLNRRVFIIEKPKE